MCIQSRYKQRRHESDCQEVGEQCGREDSGSVMEAMHLDLDDIVEVREEKGRIVIEPLRQKTYVLDELLKGITAKNRHEPVDVGSPEDKEVW